MSSTNYFPYGLYFATLTHSNRNRTTTYNMRDMHKSLIESLDYFPNDRLPFIYKMDQYHYPLFCVRWEYAYSREELMLNSKHLIEAVKRVHSQAPHWLGYDRHDIVEPDPQWPEFPFYDENGPRRSLAYMLCKPLSPDSVKPDHTPYDIHREGYTLSPIRPRESKKDTGLV